MYTIEDLKIKPIQVKVYSREQANRLDKAFGNKEDWNPYEAKYPIYIIYNQICSSCWAHREDYFKKENGVTTTIEIWEIRGFEDCLPEKWCVEGTNNSHEYLRNFTPKLFENIRHIFPDISNNIGFHKSYYYYPDKEELRFSSCRPTDYIEISFDHFKKYVLKEQPMKELKYCGEIADFPKEVVEKMLERQVEQGNKRNVSVFENYSLEDKTRGGFDWEDTKEGDYFWVRVISNKNFDLFFEKYPKQTNMNNRKIVGYKTPTDLWNGEIKKGSLYVLVKNFPTNYAFKEDKDEAYHIPKEIVETWEPVYEEKEVVRMGGENGFDLTIIDNKVYHKSKDITEFVKNIKRDYSNYINNDRIGSYDFNIKDIILSKTGCENKETRLSEWIALADKIGV